MGRYPYCGDCAGEIRRLSATQGRELRMGTIRVEPVKMAPAQTQRERNKGRPDVMQARIPERRLWPKGD